MNRPGPLLDRLWALVSGVSVRTKILGIVLGLVLLLGLGITLQVRSALANTLHHELEEQGVALGRDLAARSADPILVNDLFALHRLLQDTLTNNVDVRYAFIQDPEGRVLVHTFEGGFPRGLADANPVPPEAHHRIQILSTEEGLIWDVAVPIFEGRVGTARVGLSEQLVQQTMEDVTTRLMVTTAIVSLTGLAAGGLLAWVLTRRIQRLVHAAEAVGRGDLHHQAPVWADDEIGQLQVSFNTMVEHLARSRQEMEAYNRRLLRRNRELSALYAISHAVSGPLGLTETLERALQQATRLLSATAGWICLLGEDGSCQICVSAGEPIRPDIGLACCQRCPASREAAEACQPLVVTPLPPACPLRAITDTGSRPPIGHVAVPLLVKEQTVGLLNLVCEEENRFEAEDLDLLAAIGRQLGIAVENARLWAEVRRKEALRGELLRRIITAQEEERQRIARELHDETGQALTSLLVGLRVMEKAASEEARALAFNMRGVVTQALDEVHNLALELRPSVLDDLGLVPALARYVQDCPTRFGLQVDFVAAGLDSQRLPLEVETTLYRIAQEALTNVARHSGASHASVLLERRRGVVVLVVEDNGRGFDVVQVMASAQKRKRLGLYGIEERASLVGGVLSVESRPGAGTTISVEVPLEGAGLA